jgi:hypothetical protein
VDLLTVMMMGFPTLKNKNFAGVCELAFEVAWRRNGSVVSSDQFCCCGSVFFKFLAMPIK